MKTPSNRFDPTDENRARSQVQNFDRATELFGGVKIVAGAVGHREAPKARVLAGVYGFSHRKFGALLASECISGRLSEVPQAEYQHRDLNTPKNIIVGKMLGGYFDIWGLSPTIAPRDYGPDEDQSSSGSLVQAGSLEIPRNAAEGSIKVHYRIHSDIMTEGDNETLSLIAVNPRGLDQDHVQ